MDEQATDRDRAAAAAVERHHAQMSRTLAGTVWSLTGATRTGRLQAAEDRRAELVAWCRAELVPHALAEESTMYGAAGVLAEGRLLVAAMLAEHRAITGLVDELAATTEPVSAAALGRALQALFEVHLAKENDQVLPLLLATPGVSVAALLGGMHELLGGATDGSEGRAGGTSGPDGGGLPGGGMTRGPAGAPERSRS